jgi:hypothetical protein
MVSLGLVGEVVEVRTQVDRVLTTVSKVDRQLRLIKNPGASQPTPLKRNLVPRFDLRRTRLAGETHGFEIAGSPGTLC